jgi:hypothetical protein
MGHGIPIAAVLGSLPLFGVLIAAAPGLMRLYRVTFASSPVHVALSAALWLIGAASNLWALIYSRWSI